MCDCKDVKIGSYDNQVILCSWWGESVCIDACLKDEILWLWNKGILTTGCCCGHNIERPMINVVKEHHCKMIELDYEQWENEHGVICYAPKSIFHNENYKDKIAWLKKFWESVHLHGLRLTTTETFKNKNLKSWKH